MDKKRTLGIPKWQAFTEAMASVFEADHPVGYAVIFTDEELVDMVNEMLDEEDRISYRTFQRYKAGEIKDDDDVGIIPLFVSSYKRALRSQKANLQMKLATDVPGGWQRYAWILERKFDEWNLRAKSVDETPDVGRLVFRVIGDDEAD